MIRWYLPAILVSIATLVLSQMEEVEEKGEVRAIFLQKSAVPSAESYARLQTSFPVLNNFTACYFVRIHRFREESTLMSYAVSGNKDNELRMDHRQNGYKVSIHSTWATTNIKTPLVLWTHYCITFLSETDEWEIYENGLIKASGKLPKYEGPLDGDGAYIIGQEQDSFGGDFQRDQSFSGELTELNFWSRRLSSNDIKKLARCEWFAPGDALAWSEMEWAIHGEVEWTTYERKSFCQRTKRRTFFFPIRVNLKQAHKFCQVLGGAIVMPQSLEENTLLYETSLPNANYCANNMGWSYMWLGATDEEEERVWRYIGNSSKIQFEGPWRGNGPNGGTEENCLVMLYGDFAARWSDIACLESYSFCVACMFDDIISMYLKGPLMCDTSPFNYEYFLDRDQGNNRSKIAGKMHSEIYWDDATQAWTLKSLKNTGAIARFTPTQKEVYPLGKNSWKLEGNVCGYSTGDSLNLTFSACGQGYFTCNDGTCINLKKRCDLRLDCPDASDERDCSQLDIPPGYMNMIPPPPTQSPDPLNIILIINIISFPAIRTQELSYDISFKLRLQWIDKRLSFLNLKEQRSLNLLTDKDVNNIWTPKIFFSNALGNIFSNLNEGTRIECIPQGESQNSHRDKESERNIFKGSETILDMGQYYSVAYSCSFDLLMFPFDAQLCSMEFTLMSASAEYMSLTPKLAEYSGEQDLIEYTIGDLIMNRTILDTFSSVTIRVRFLRRYGFYLLTLYIPSVLLVTIAYATLFFNPGDFNSRIVVALTALLVLSSLFTQTSNSLPKTSYFKLVDAWLFFSILIIFFVVLFQTLSEYFTYDSLSNMKPASTSRIIKVGTLSDQSSKENGNIKKFDFCGLPFYIIALYLGRTLIPLIYAIFNIWYWVSALRYLSENVWLYNSNNLTTV